jgi:hypothetical protein
MKTGRRTVAVATLVGALGLSVLNAPAAQAADTGITVSDNAAVRGDDPGFFLRGGAHAAVADPFLSAFLDLADTRVNGGFQWAEKRRKFHLGNT